MKNKYFKLYSNCIPVKGAKNYIICDLQRHSIYKITEGLYEILTLHKNQPWNKIQTFYPTKINNILKSNIQFLLKNELGFWCDDPEKFPDIEMNWKHPSHITNAVLEIDSTSTYKIENVIFQLEKLGCKFIEFRIYHVISIESISKILHLFEGTIFRNISFCCAYTNEMNENSLTKLIVKYQRIGFIYIHSCPISFNVSEDLRFHVKTTSNKIIDNSCCGIVSPNYFSVNLKMFVESHSHNSCLNRKLSIDKDGEIKNCPSMPVSFGNIKNTTLQEALNKPGFKKYWNITKDQIEICKDCEYRYVCTDCRVYLQNSSNIYSKPLKCGYNPYEGVWDELSLNPIKDKKIESI